MSSGVGRSSISSVLMMGSRRSNQKGLMLRVKRNNPFNAAGFSTLQLATNPARNALSQQRHAKLSRNQLYINNTAGCIIGGGNDTCTSITTNTNNNINQHSHPHAAVSQRRWRRNRGGGIHIGRDPVTGMPQRWVFKPSKPNPAMRINRPKPPVFRARDPEPVGHPYRLVGACLLERFPIITPDKTPYEEEYGKFAAEIEEEKSAYTEEELIMMDEDRRKIQLQKERDEEKRRANSLFADEDEEMLERQKIKFTPQPRITEHDESGNMRTLNRRLSKMLYLVVKKRREYLPKGVEDPYEWQLPHTVRKPGQSMRQTAEKFCHSLLARATRRSYFFSKAPDAMYSYDFPADYDNTKNNIPERPVPDGMEPQVDRSERELTEEEKAEIERKGPCTGVKAFVFRGEYTDDHLIKSPVRIRGTQFKDYRWVTKDEMKDLMHPSIYEKIEPCLVDYHPY
eukprot:Nk52_evm6s150 gene=Nk52_evmTU6s150